jgi:hypothetical protein
MKFEDVSIAERRSQSTTASRKLEAMEHLPETNGSDRALITSDVVNGEFCAHLNYCHGY